MIKGPENMPDYWPLVEALGKYYMKKVRIKETDPREALRGQVGKLGTYDGGPFFFVYGLDFSVLVSAEHIEPMPEG